MEDHNKDDVSHEDARIARRWEEDRHCRLVRREGWVPRFLGHPVLTSVLAWSAVAICTYLLIVLWPVMRLMQ
jgi:hypothetical protein